MATIYDTFIIGGGINGVGVALDAATRGMSVMLCEQNDFASATSSASSKLIHGGLRYLENLEFRLVFESLREREILLKSAPHLVSTTKFIMPYAGKLRPKWLIRLGLFLYDILASSKILPKSKAINFTTSKNNPLNLTIKYGFSYYDCKVDDARLVIACAMLARDKGAVLNNYTKFKSANRENNLWKIEIEQNGQSSIVLAKTIVNTAGPWADKIAYALASKSKHNLRLVKGSHIVVQRLYDSDEAYILQNKDRRVIFVIPFQKYYSLIGTTDVDHKGKPNEGEVSSEEIEYLCDCVNRYFHHTISAKDVLWSFWGVRPLVSDNEEAAQNTTRDYVIDVEKNNSINVFGGKLTTFRKLAKNVVDKLATILHNSNNCVTDKITLPGGDFNYQDYDKIYAKYLQKYSFLETKLIENLVYRYGTKIEQILENVKSVEDLGEYFGKSLYQKEVDYLCQYEWVKTLDDLIWRRTKIGLKLSSEQKEKLNFYLSQSIV